MSTETLEIQAIPMQLWCFGYDERHALCLYTVGMPKGNPPDDSLLVKHGLLVPAGNIKALKLWHEQYVDLQFIHDGDGKHYHLRGITLEEHIESGSRKADVYMWMQGISSGLTDREGVA
jgi:hypothetical protein